MFALCSIRGGVRMGRTKLTVEQVLDARLRCASGEREFSELAREYGVSRETVRNAVEGLTFKYLPMPQEAQVRTSRNPRRAYDGNRNEIPPVTVGQSLAEGYRTVMAYCEAHDCGHDAEVPLKGWPPD